MTHLGDRVTDLVDGQLGPDATERAHAHLARCMPCREAVEAERLTKSRLASLPGPAPTAELTSRLLAIGRPGQAAVPPAAGPSRPGRLQVPDRPSTPAATTRPAGRSVRAGTGPGRRPRRARLAVAVVGALSAVGAAGLSLSSAALLPGSVVPTVAAYLVEHTATVRDLPFVDLPGSWQDDEDGDVPTG